MTTLQPSEPKTKTEIIAFSSGKGGTGKTLVAACLGYVLTKIGLSVLMIDTDIATDGLSLYLLGPSGYENVDKIPPSSIFSGILQQYKEHGNFQFKSWKINRGGVKDHEVTYEAIISGSQMYGDRFGSPVNQGNTQLDRESYRHILQTMFDALRSSGEYDYVIVDTRGGFSDESTDVSALADSYIVVTESDVTSFYQNRNLVRYIDTAASEIKKTAVLRAFIVNKATPPELAGNEEDLRKLESSFRLNLEEQFHIPYTSTYPLPLSLDALKVQKFQQIPIRSAPDSNFSYAFLVAFHTILSVVTQPWTKEQAAGWNAIVDGVNDAIEKRNAAEQQAALAQQASYQELEQLRKNNADYVNRIESLKDDIKRIEEQYQREVKRSDQIIAANLSKDKKTSPPVIESKKVVEPRRNYILSIIGLLAFGAVVIFALWKPLALFTPTASATATLTATAAIPTETRTSIPETATLQPNDTTKTVQPTNTQAPTEAATSTPNICPSFDKSTAKWPNNASLVAETDVKGATVPTGQKFNKIWLIQNTGTKTWNTAYSIANGGGDAIGVQGPIYFSKEVQPGECLDISITFTTPNIPGNQHGVWILQDESNIRFGFGTNNIGALEVFVTVSPALSATP